MHCKKKGNQIIFTDHLRSDFTQKLKIAADQIREMLLFPVAEAGSFYTTLCHLLSPTTVPIQTAG